MAVCAICEKNKGKRKCRLEAASVCIECCEKVKNSLLCADCKSFKDNES